MDINRESFDLGGYRDHPIVVHKRIDGFVPSNMNDALLNFIFGKKAKGLKTWPKPGDELHWLACRNGINLHVDRTYSRYAYQLVVRNDGWIMTGYNQDKQAIIPPGSVYIIDTHSPHQLVRSEDCRGRFFVGVGFDSKELLSIDDAASSLLKYHNQGQP